MTPKSQISCVLLVLALLLPAAAQVSLNPGPARVLGHPQTALKTANPNLVEGRELYGPTGVAVDATANPPILYVADTGNNRVLGWRNAIHFSNGTPADIVIGQRDMFSTFPQGPSIGDLNGGLNGPTGLAVDGNGNLFVADSGNNRILRYPRPFEDPNQVKLPTLILGQKDSTTRSANNDFDTHAISARTLSLSSSTTFLFADLLFDPSGNLFVSDAANKRVLRYKAADVAPGATTNYPAADLVLGQTDFISAPLNPTNIGDLNRLLAPAGLAMDAQNRLYVCDPLLHRVLVYPEALFSGGAALRMIGGIVSGSGGVLDPPAFNSLNSPYGVFFAGGVPYVVDSFNSRILRFPAYDSWPDLPTQPNADGVIGQPDFFSNDPNRGDAWPSASVLSLFVPIEAARSAGTNDLFVCDNFNNRVLRVDDPGSTAPASVGYKEALGQAFYDHNGLNRIEGREFHFGSGGGVVVDTRSNPPRLYVADTLNNRILGFADSRKARPGDKADLVIGQPSLERSTVNYPENKADKPSQKSLYHPTGLAVDTAGNLYVADSDNGRVVRYSRPFDGGNHPNADLVLGKPNFTAARDPGADPSATNMGQPYGLAITLGGHLLVSDTAFNRVLLFFIPQGGDFSNGMAAGKVIGQGGDFFTKTAGNSPGNMWEPRHISTDSSDRLYVCDSRNNRILAFENVTQPPAIPQAAFVLTDAGAIGGISNPIGVYVSPVTGEIWVANSGTSYFLRYPAFETLIINPQGRRPEVAVSASSLERPMALTVDGFSNLLVVYNSNRVAFFFAAAAAINAASYQPRLAPGMITALYPMGGAFGNDTASAPGLPLPQELADIQVVVRWDDVDHMAYLLFVSPYQINFMLPMTTPLAISPQIRVERKSLGQVLAVACLGVKIASNPDRFVCSTNPLVVDDASPGLFAGLPDYSRGKEQIAAMNVRASDGTYYGMNGALDTINGRSPVARLDWVEVLGTGQGFVVGAPTDGAAPGQGYPTEVNNQPRVIVNVKEVPSNEIQSDLYPYYPGIWRVKFRVPNETPPGNAIQVVIVQRGRLSNDGGVITTIAVKQ